MLITDKMKDEFDSFARLKEVQRLKNGHFSNLFLIKDQNNKVVPFRFYNNNNKLQIIYKSSNHKNIELSLVSDKSKIGFYDKELQMTLFIKREHFEEQCGEEVNFNLSNEQKELLSEGKDITLEVNSQIISNNSMKLSYSKNNATKSINSNTYKNFIADLTFFLGKCSSLIIEKKEKYNIKHSLKNIDN